MTYAGHGAIASTCITIIDLSDEMHCGGNHLKLYQLFITTPRSITYGIIVIRGNNGK